jgi:hypothetical protein
MLKTIAHLFARERGRAGSSQARSRRARPPHRRSLVFEAMESRLLLSADLFGIPDWQDQGAAPIEDAQVNVPPGNFATGAVESIAINPNNTQQMFVGTVNGGVWRTNNADPTNPDATTWTPLTDQQASLAMGDVAFSPLDPTGNTLFAGTGSFSSLSQSGGPAIGVLRTTDGGATWNTFALGAGAQNQVKVVCPTSIDLDAGAGVQECVLVGTVGGGGLYRSDDNGQTYSLLSGANGLPNADISQLVADPNNANRFYAGVAGQGVYRGDFDAVTGVITWVASNNGITSPGAANIQIAARNSGGNTVLFALLSGSSQSAYRSGDGGANWTPLATPPALFQRDVTVRAGNTIVIDPTNDQVCYIATYGGGNDIFRYNPGTTSWDVIDNSGAAGNTAPHADARDLAFQGSNVLVESCDGGIYFIQDPLNSSANAWHAYIGGNGTGLGDVEFHNIAWDQRFDVIAGGAQDNGTQVQQGTGDRVWTHFQGGDGGDVAIDSDSIANRSIRYASSQNMGSLTRYVFDSADNIVQTVGILPGSGLSNFSGPFVPHFETNSIAAASGQSRSLVVGGGGTSPVYIATMPDVVNSNADVTWTAVPVAAGFGSVNALAFGGMRNGVANADVLYAGTSSGLFLRTTAGGTLNATSAAFPGGGVNDIALDPNDWQHIFVANGTGVWESTDAGATWTNRTGNLNATNIQTIEYAEAGAIDAVLVGAQGGVFRMITNSPGVWSEYGQFMPNVVVYDLDYNYADNVVVAGTLGRGAWVVNNARSTLTVTGVLQITGDDDFAGEDDTILLVRDPNNNSMLDVTINGVTTQYQMSALQQINVDSLGGNDLLKVDSSNGLINVGNGIRYNGGAGVDKLQLLQSGGATQTSDTYSVGPATGMGSSMIVGPGSTGTQTVYFENLSPVLDLVPSAVLTVNATAAANAINYSVASVATDGLVTIDEQESVEFANKTTLVLNAAAGTDTVGINNPGTPVGLTGITVNGGDPNSGDTLNIAGAGADVTINTGAGTIAGATGALGVVGLSYSGIEALNLLSGVAALTLSTTAADDALTVTPGASAGGSNSGTLVSNGVLPSIAFANAGALTANLAGGNDSLTVNGSSLADAMVIGGAAVTMTGRNAVNFSGVESLAVNGLAGNDSFDITPAALPIFIDGGDPIGTLPGDRLNILAGGQAVVYNAGAHSDEGSFDVGASAPVSFDNIESFGISGSGAATINGTNGPDAITVIARDASTHAGADGVQDFTVSVNGGPALLFLNVASLAVNALGGSDEVTLAAPAPNNAAWDVDVSINGGPPAADSDKLIVQTPGAAAETLTYAPGAADGGTLDMVSLSSLVSFTEMELFSYDGQGDNDSLSVLGTAADDTVVHTPGATNQSGSVSVNGLLAMSYFNLGAAGSLTVDGGGGTDTLVCNGTPGNDQFVIGAAGQVSLNSRIVVYTARIEVLTLEGFDGDDSFTLQPPVSASVYPLINIHGGSQASALGDRVYLVGTAGNDSFIIGGQVVTLGAVTINASGVENISIDALGGDDLLTYNGVAGVTENITVSSSGVAGGGQISVPNVTQIGFAGVERIDVNGNTPTPTETDTLSFAGTNASDIFNINLSAAGTDADPIAALKNSSGQTLLILRNYTNFDTLRVNGLDGADTFNVYTSATGPSRNLFVDGGLPSGKKKSTDVLNVFYTPPRPRIIQSTATQDPDAGLVDLDYTTARYLVQYDDIELVTIQKKT